jgi:YidC/Oxa1 family membrane protein insertase
MDRNQTIGIILITILVFAWSIFTGPSKEELEEARRQQDSIEQSQKLLASELADDEVKPISNEEEVSEESGIIPGLDTMDVSVATEILGPFAAAFSGEETIYTIENEDLVLKISNKGGVIHSAELKKFSKIRKEREGVTLDVPVQLLEDKKNRFSYQLPFGHPSGNFTASDRLYFNVISQSDKQIVLEAKGQSGKSVRLTYGLDESGYKVSQDLQLQGIDNDKVENAISLEWIDYLDKIEQNFTYEKIYSTVYFKEIEDDPDYCSCRSDDQETISQPLKWISHANQFFNSSIIPDKPFLGGTMETVVLDDEAEDLKLLKSSLALHEPGGTNADYSFNWYIGPNDFEKLASFDMELEMIIPFGWSIFGTINRWVIRPLFDLLFKFMGSAGIAIIILTLIVKFVLYPLTYKMLHSQAKMSALKPEIEKIRNKFKDKQQDQQMETMKLYREFGVNPLGGCMPMVLQMPIWFALYRFFPASLEFRQASFWWAHDLSSFDAITFLPYEIPFYGSHVSLFTLLWSATMLIYAVYNTRLMDMTTASNPMLKYMQYVTPVMFIFFFNNYASGLTCYLFFSTLTNIIQTVGTKELIFDDEKIKKQLEANKNKPKKKSSFQERLEAAMKEQQKQQQSRSQKRK